MLVIRLAAMAAAGDGMGWLVLHSVTTWLGAFAGLSVTKIGTPVSPKFYKKRKTSQFES